MANLITLYWRDIPAQVIAELGCGRNVSRQRLNCRDVFRLPLMLRQCAMVWNRPMITQSGAERSLKNAEDLEAEAAVKAAELDNEYTSETSALVENGGKSASTRKD